MPEDGLDEAMSEGLHDMCYRNARIEADKYIAGLRAAQAEAAIARVVPVKDIRRALDGDA